MRRHRHHPLIPRFAPTCDIEDVIAELDPSFVRGQFPAFEEPSLQEWAYLESAGGSFSCRQVIERLDGFYRRTKLQGYAHHAPGAAAAEAVAAAAPALARWLGVPPDHVHVGPSMTQNTYVLAHAFADVLSPGQAIVVTDQDHEANSGVWRRLAERRGLTLREWQVDPATGALDLSGLDRLLDDDVALVAFPHVSNIVGQINDVAAACARIAGAGAVSVVDGVAAAPHGLPDVGALGADVYLFSAYKTWGPHQGVMTIAPDLVERLPNQGHHFNADQVGKRLVPAGPDHAQVAALTGIAEYLDALAAHLGTEQPRDVADAVRRRETALLAPLLEAVRDTGLRIIGPDHPTDDRVPTVSVATERPGLEVAADLAAHGIACAGGHFYAPRLCEALGIDPAHGVLRLSFLHYTSEDEIDRVCEALRAVV